MALTTSELPQLSISILEKTAVAHIPSPLRRVVLQAPYWERQPPHVLQNLEGAAMHAAGRAAIGASKPVLRGRNARARAVVGGRWAA